MGTFSVVNNIASLEANRYLSLTQISLNATLAKLSSGYRINKSGDDAAGLAVANSYRTQVSVFSQGERNANEGLSRLQIVDGSINNISLLLDRMSTLATQSASGTFQGSRTTLNAEFTQIRTEIDREAQAAGMQTGGAFLNQQSVFVGGPTGTTVVSFNNTQAVDSTGLAIGALDISTVAGAQTAVTSLATALASVGTAQGTVGSAENRLGFAISLVKSQITNTQAAEGIIRDANFALESSNLAKYSILSQSGIASLAQSNAAAANVLALLR